jgi:tetratricopeptide (TPR) repeat protein
MPFLFTLLVLFAQQARDLRIEKEIPPNTFGDKGTRWAIVIGVSEHEHLPAEAQLRFAHRDAEDFATFLRSTAGGGLPSSHVRLLTDKGATLATIRAALHTWLVDSAKPEDVVYVFFAGHGVVAERNEGYFLAADSDPQNLHATGLSFAEVEQTLSSRLKASLVVFTADACHAGQLGWTTYAAGNTGKTSEALEGIAPRDRAILKLLSARPTERSYEDAKWDGGHGVFTFSLLEALRGRADKDGDRFVRAAEVIDFVSQRVAAETSTKQNPRVAGTFDARLPLAVLPAEAKPIPPLLSAAPVSLEVRGPGGTALYIDRVFRGSLPAGGVLRLDGLVAGLHSIAADFPAAPTLEGSIRLVASNSRLDLVPPAAKMQSEAVLEQQGQACVSDYVQSTAVGPKKVLLERAVAAYETLKGLRPYDRSVETKRLFCAGRLAIAQNRFEQATTDLRAAILRDPNFACAHNALGVAYGRLGKLKEARASLDTAAELTPEWALPPFQIAGILIAAGKAKEALPFLEKAVRLNPLSRSTRWSLTRSYRDQGKLQEALKAAEELIRLAPEYAPGYFELARTYDLGGNSVRAVEAYEVYLQLAPNFGDSDAVRARTRTIRSTMSKKDLAALEK